ncbi:MAG: TIM-barrel domain-containing protein, partial [Candidatus Dadabacteria bacterium]
ELYVRWLQFAVFTPIFRPHGTALYEMDPAAHSFPSEPALIGHPYRQYAKEAVRLRYQLLDYNYSLAYEQAKNGKPLMAPLYYHFATDTTASKIEDEYMWGENFLVTPVLEKGVKTRNYYLPKGKWYELQNYKFLEGGAWYSDTLSLTSIPVFIKEGSFIPLDNVTPITNVANARGIESIVYLPSQNRSKYSLFDDDGKSKHSVGNKRYNLVQFQSTGVTNSRIRITINNQHTDLKRPFRKKFKLVIPGLERKPSRVMLNNKAVKFSSTANAILINLSYTGQPLSIVIDL